MSHEHKQKDIDYSRCWNDPNEAYTVTENGIAIPRWNEKLKLFKLWFTKRHTKLLKNSTIWTDFAKEDTATFKCIMLLIDYVDTGNMLMIRNNYSKESRPITNEKELAQLLGLSRSSWFKIKKNLFDKTTPVLSKLSSEFNGVTYTFFFMNPLIAIDWRGISIPCYQAFRDSLYNIVETSDRYSLEKHSKELIVGDSSWFNLNKGQLDRIQ